MRWKSLRMRSWGGSSVRRLMNRVLRMRKIKSQPRTMSSVHSLRNIYCSWSNRTNNSRTCWEQSKTNSRSTRSWTSNCQSNLTSPWARFVISRNNWPSTGRRITSCRKCSIFSWRRKSIKRCISGSWRGSMPGMSKATCKGSTARATSSKVDREEAIMVVWIVMGLKRTNEPLDMTHHDILRYYRWIIFGFLFFNWIDNTSYKFKLPNI